MSSLLINRHKSFIDLRHAGFSIRTAYIFSPKLLLAGIYSDIYQTLHNTTSLRLQIEIIKKRGSDKEKEVIKQGEKLLNAINRKKHRSAEDIAYIKTLKRLANEGVEALNAGMKQTLSNHRIPHLNKRTWDGAIDFVNIDDENPETTDEWFTRLSKLFLPDGTLHLLPPELVMDPDVKELLGPLNGHVDRNGVYLRQVLSIDGIVFPTESELVLMRSQLIGRCGEYTTALNVWAKLYSDSSISRQQRLDCLNNIVSPQMAAMQRLLDENDIVQQYSGAGYHRTTVHLYVGEIPAPVVWQFYRDQDVIGDATLQILQDAQQPGAISSYPVMFIHLPYLYEEEPVTETDVVLTRKKSLNID